MVRGIGQTVDEKIGGLIRVTLYFGGKSLALVRRETNARAGERRQKETAAENQWATGGWSDNAL